MWWFLKPWCSFFKGLVHKDLSLDILFIFNIGDFFFCIAVSILLILINLFKLNSLFHSGIIWVCYRQEKNTSIFKKVWPDYFLDFIVIGFELSTFIVILLIWFFPLFSLPCLRVCPLFCSTDLLFLYFPFNYFCPDTTSSLINAISPN